MKETEATLFLMQKIADTEDLQTNLVEWKDRD